MSNKLNNIFGQSGSDVVTLDGSQTVTGAKKFLNLSQPVIYAGAKVINPTEISFLDGLGSNIQNQINAINIVLTGLTALEQALQAIEPSPAANVVQFNNTIFLNDPSNSNLFVQLSARGLDITDTVSTGNSAYSYDGITVSGTQGSFFASPTNVAVANGNSSAILDNGSGPAGTVCFQAGNGTNQIQYTTTGVNLSNTAFNIQGGDLILGSNNIDAVNNINLNTINGYYPTTIGLSWSDFNAGNAYYGLPNNSYQLNNASSSNFTTTQSNLQFNIYNSSTGSSTVLAENTLSTTSQDLTISAGGGSNQINLACSSFTINGIPLATGSVVYSFPATNNTYLSNYSPSSPTGASVYIPAGTYTITYTLTFDGGAFWQSSGYYAMIRGCVGIYAGGTFYYPNGYANNYLPSTLLSFDNSYPCSVTAVDTIVITSGNSCQMFGFQNNSQGNSGNTTISATLVQQ